VPNNSGEHGVARTNYRNIMRHVEEKKFKEKCNKERVYIYLHDLHFLFKAVHVFYLKIVYGDGM
jgi:hypothetical protein